MAQKVLFPLDGSERSFQAMEKALVLLKGMKMDATLFVVMQEGFEKAGDDRIEDFDADEGDEIFPNVASCERMLDEAEARCKALGLKHPGRKIGKGRVPQAIIDEAPNHDLMVLHDLDKKGLLEKLRLSNTEKVARQSRVNVLLVEDDWSP